MEDTQSSPSIPETVSVSEEDLPSHKFSFNGEDEEDEGLGGAPGFASVNSSMSRYS